MEPNHRQSTDSASASNANSHSGSKGSGHSGSPNTLSFFVSQNKPENAFAKPSFTSNFAGSDSKGSFFTTGGPTAPSEFKSAFGDPSPSKSPFLNPPQTIPQPPQPAPAPTEDDDEDFDGENAEDPEEEEDDDEELEDLEEESEEAPAPLDMDDYLKNRHLF